MGNEILWLLLIPAVCCLLPIALLIRDKRKGWTSPDDEAQALEMLEDAARLLRSRGRTVSLNRDNGRVVFTAEPNGSTPGE